MTLPSPNVLDLPDETPLVLRVERWERGEVDIRPPRDGRVLRVPTLRVYGAVEEGPARGQYLDIVSKRLMTILQPWLDADPESSQRFRIIAYGSGPARNFDVRVLEPVGLRPGIAGVGGRAGETATG